MKSFVITAALAVAPAVLALPDVVAKPLPDGCSSYPKYNDDTGVAGPWLLQAADTENQAINGFYNTDVYSISFNPGKDRKPSIRWGFITFPTNNQIAKTRLQCQNGTLNAYVANDLTPAGAPTDFKDTPLVLSPYPYDASLMYKIEGEKPKIFEHYIDGVKQDGVYLGGYDNSTTWGFQYQPANAGSSDMDYYYIRLLGPNSADPNSGAPLKANETRGFIKVGL